MTSTPLNRPRQAIKRQTYLKTQLPCPLLAFFLCSSQQDGRLVDDPAFVGTEAHGVDNSHVVVPISERPTPMWLTGRESGWRQGSRGAVASGYSGICRTDVPSSSTATIPLSPPLPRMRSRVRMAPSRGDVPDRMRPTKISGGRRWERKVRRSQRRYGENGSHR